MVHNIKGRIINIVVATLQIMCMSATLNAEKFLEYFGGPDKCSMVEIPGRTFPVEQIYLDDLVRNTG